METSNSTQTAPNPAKPNPATSNPFTPNAPGMMPGGGPNVSRAFGEPIVAQGRTIIPVAMVAMGMRGGFMGQIRGLFGRPMAGQQPANEANGASGGAPNGAPNGTPGEGHRRGGMMRRAMVRPVGFIDITDGGSRFVPIAPGRFVALGFALAFIMGGLVRGRRRRWMRDQG